MIYTTGTVNTVSGSAIVKGTGTKFKNNNPAINIGMTILIKSGNTNIPYMIKSVNSDTELLLAQPALATATNTTFSIHITEPDNNSDAARTMVAINAYTQYFLDAMNTWMSETGQTKIEMPNGETITLDSIKKMQADIANRADKSSSNEQFFAGAVSSKYITSVDGDNKLGMRARETGNVILTSRTSQTNEIKIPDKSGSMMLTGDYGIGLINNYVNNDYLTNLSNINTSFFAQGASSGNDYFGSYGCGVNIRYDNNGSGRLFIFGSGNACSEHRSGTTIRRNNLWGTLNTSVDTNGFIKRASPVININPDGTFTTNDESEGATVTRVAQGEYLIEGVLGFNSDAGWGGVDGGIEIPLDVNKQPLIWVNSKVNKDGSILVKTYHRTHPDAPSFANNEIEDFKNGDPIDIPAGRFISVRVQMPEQSIYNVRMREMEEAQKTEEERRQKEEEENQDTNKTPEIDN